jgi:hypothetical protein
VYGGNAYGSAPYAGGASGAAAPVVVTIPAGMLGRLRSGSAEVSLDVPVAAVPAGLTLATRVDKALAYPTPTLVDGRPT